MEPMETDLFGDPIQPVQRATRGGYAAPPGTGPKDKTCRDCLSYTHGGTGARAWPKCELCRPNWTSGSATDIKARSPACSLFAPK